MFYTIDCRVDIAAQDADEPTYKYVDCDLHVDKNTYPDFYGRLIDCDLSIIVTLVAACKSWEQAIRVAVVIGDIDVTDALVGTININHNKNMISTFSLQLGDSQYSPLTNPYIAPNKEVVITSYLNKHEAKLFTGLIDDTSTSYDGGYVLTINGSDYGKKLRNKRTTLISIQDSATSHYRGALVKYMASQAGVTNVDAPQGSLSMIDHSFEDQTILDMITKELVAGTYWWRFDEEGTLKIALDEIKTSTGTYPTPDWSYGEDRFFNLGLLTSDGEIINRVKILGTVYETQILVTDVDSGSDSPYSEYYYPKQLFSASLSYTDEEEIFYNANSNYTKTVGDFTLKLNAYSYSAGGGNIHIHIGNSDQFIFQAYTITSIDYTFDGITFRKLHDQVSAGGTIGLHCIMFVLTRRGPGKGYTGDAFTFNVTVNGYSEEEMDDEAPAQSDETSPTYDYHYDQVAVEIIDSNLIAKYGERKPNSEGTLEFPLAENIDQCEVIGKKIIRDSRRLTKQPDFEIPFNPLLRVGQTISITDKKIGYSERWYVEEVNHTIEQGRGRTRAGCVYYA